MPGVPLCPLCVYRGGQHDAAFAAAVASADLDCIPQPLAHNPARLASCESLGGAEGHLGAYLGHAVHRPVAKAGKFRVKPCWR